MTIQYKANSLCLSRDWEGKSFSATPASTRQSHKIILAIISGVSHYVPRITFIDPGSRRDASPTQISPKDRSHGTWLLKISIFQIAKPRSRATSCVESVDFSQIIVTVCHDITQRGKCIVGKCSPRIFRNGPGDSFRRRDFLRRTMNQFFPETNGSFMARPEGNKKEARLEGRWLSSFFNVLAEEQPCRWNRSRR